MKKTVIIGGAVVVCVALGIFVVAKMRGKAALASDDENVQTVVAVQTGVLKRMTLRHYVTGYGTVEAQPAMKNQSAAGGVLAAPGAGVVAKVNVVAGQSVKKGDVLAELNSAAATFDYAKAEVARQEKLFKQQNTSLKNLEDARAQLASLEIVAPVSGTVARLDVREGQAVDVNTPVMDVVDLSRLAVATKIPASQAGGLKAGEEVQIAGLPLAAKLSFVSSVVDSADGTVSAWAALPVDSGLRPGEFVDLKIVTMIHTDCLAAPGESVVTDQNGNSVIALVKGDEETQVPVKTDFREDGWVEVQGNGLKEGDSVVTVGAYGLPDKTKIQIENPSDETSATNSPEAQ